MTYCVGMLLDAGLVFLGDSRTNAGVDQISMFRKVTVFEWPGGRVLVLMSSGNLAITQSVVSLLRERLAEADSTGNLWEVPNLFEAARHVGDCLREVFERDAAALKSHHIDFSAAMILGGQIRGEAPRLFHIYAAGNFIEATPDTPYFQIGESKYGKPILDRVLTSATPLAEASKCALISMDSTLRSNLSVGLPLDLICVQRDGLKVFKHVNIDEKNPYFNMIHSQWGQSLRTVFAELPDPDWLL